MDGLTLGEQVGVFLGGGLGGFEPLHRCALACCCGGVLDLDVHLEVCTGLDSDVQGLAECGVVLG